MIGAADQPLTWFGLPADALGWGAGLLGLALLVPQVGRRWARLGPAWLVRAPLLVPLLALLAALGSAAYFELVLGGRPRIIDASTYLLEARTFARGHFTFTTSEASALFRGRFLSSPPGSPSELGPIFPPGYPAILSLAVRLGDYRLLGPLLAFLTTCATAWLGFAVTRRRSVALLAALFSVLSLAVRYHTADTMSHGWSMLLTTGCLGATVILARASPSATAASTLLGLCLGGLGATRPLTAVAIGLACAGALLSEWKQLDWKSLHLGRFVLGLVPGALLLGLHHYALTGSPFASPQLAYYALADGPPGCFHLGLGAGCRVEHGDVVLAQGGHGLTFAWMLQNTWHRLHWHSLDVANCEPLLLVAWLYLARTWRRGRTRALPLAVVALPAAYALFYFQGSYPGGGARFLSELLPALHVALAAGLLALRAGAFGVGLALVGYAGHAAHVHAALPSAPPLTTIPGPDGLPQATTDHAFNLLFMPGRIESGRPPSVVRPTNDARRWSPGGSPERALFEAEADWPLLAQSGVWNERVHLSDPCVSGGRALRLHPSAPASPSAWIELELAGVPPGEYQMVLWVWSRERGCTPFPQGQIHLPRRHRALLADFGSDGAQAPVDLDRVELLPVTRSERLAP